MLLEAGMRELTAEEIDQVQGGFGPGGAVVGAIVSGAGSYLSGGNAGQIASAAILGGVAGFFGGLGGVAMQSTGLAVGLIGAYTASRPNPIRYSMEQH